MASLKVSDFHFLGLNCLTNFAHIILPALIFAISIEVISSPIPKRKDQFLGQNRPIFKPAF